MTAGILRRPQSPGTLELRSLEGINDLDRLTALSPLPEPSRPLLWRGYGERCLVLSPRHLAVLVSTQNQFGDFGIISFENGQGRWGQTMRLSAMESSGRLRSQNTRDDEFWVVEVHDGTPEDYARRVVRGNPGDYPWDAGYQRVPIEEFRPREAAAILWGWMDTGRTDGYWRTMRHHPPDDRAEIGRGDD